MKKILPPLVLIILLQPIIFLKAQDLPTKMDDKERAVQIQELKFGMLPISQLLVVIRTSGVKWPGMPA